MPIPSLPSAGSVDYGRIIHACRLELEAAGNPAFVVVLVDEDQDLHLSPMVFATVFPASDLAKRIARGVEEGEEAVVVSRHAQGRRAMYAVLDPVTLRKRYEQLEVIERTFAETDHKI